MAQTVRFGISMDAELLAAFDSLLTDSGYANRSEAVRDLVRQAIIRTNWEQNTPEAAAVLCLVHPTSTSGSPGKTAAAEDRQEPRTDAILHVNLGDQDAVEIRVLRGSPRQLEQLANQAISAKGIRHGCLVPLGGSLLPAQRSPVVDPMPVCQPGTARPSG